MRKFLTKNIIILAFVSFFTDIASEMLYPVMPLYLKTIGYGVLAVALIEGLSELVSGINKLFVGNISDQVGRRNIFIQIGYAISTFSKPAIGFMQSAGLVFALRFADRIGKGIRTSPRDAVIAAESKEEERGRAFGFHRGMDTLGAVVGPIIGLSFLFVQPGSYKALFLFSLIPGLFALFLTLLLVKEKKPAGNVERKRYTLKSFLNFWNASTPMYKRMVCGFFAFALINSSNMLLILRAKEFGISEMYILAGYILYNLVYAVASYPMGMLGDRKGFKNVYLAGILIFAAVYAIFGQDTLTTRMMLAVFALYGIFSAIDDGTSKAWLTFHIAKEYRGTGLGLQMLLSSIGFLGASVGTALVWNLWGGTITFSIVSLLSLFISAYFFFFIPNSRRVS
jgi:MFS family permease